MSVLEEIGGGCLGYNLMIGIYCIGVGVIVGLLVVQVTLLGVPARTEEGGPNTLGYIVLLIAFTWPLWFSPIYAMAKRQD
jgi:hypothetical protein